MSPLDNVALRLILTSPKNALIKQYVKLFKMDKINLQFTPGALDYIVEKALQFKLGARGLRSLCKAILNDAMYQLPKTDIKELNVNKKNKQNAKKNKQIVNKNNKRCAKKNKNKKQSAKNKKIYR